MITIHTIKDSAKPAPKAPRPLLKPKCFRPPIQLKEKKAA